MRHALAVLILAGCPGGTTDKTDATDTTDVTDATPSGDTAKSCVPTFEDDCKTYGAKGQRCAELSTTGTGTVTADKKSVTYDGTETVSLFSLDTKSTVCEIQYSLVQGTDRSKDCPGNCEWAFEFTTADTTILTNEDDACDGVLAHFEICDVKELDGRTFVRGYDPDWEGHAQVIWTTRDGKWEVISFSKLNSKTDNLDYVWFDGVWPY